MITPNEVELIAKGAMDSWKAGYAEGVKAGNAELVAALKRARDMLSAVAGDIEDGYSLTNLRDKYLTAVINARDAAWDVLAKVAS